jgi:hypothetical protein
VGCSQGSRRGDSVVPAILRLAAIGYIVSTGMIAAWRMAHGAWRMPHGACHGGTMARRATTARRTREDWRVNKSRLSLTLVGANGADAGRRVLLAFGIRVALAVGFVGCRAAGAAGCTDPDNLSGANVALRRSVEYTEFSSDDKKTCLGCGFFKASAGGCGTCQILSGLVSAAGHCTSWSARASGP